MKKIFLLMCFVLSIEAHTVKQKTDNLDILLKEAEETQQRIIKVLQGIPYGIEIVDPGIKGMKTINRLLKTRNTADEITDYSRSTIVVNDFQSIYWCLEELKKFVDVVSIDDHFLYPFETGYRDLNVIFKDPINDHIGEIQINARAIVDINKVIGHQLFDIIRTTKSKEKLENRPLTQEELNLIGDLIIMNKVANNTAFKRSCDSIRLGVYGICIRDGKVLMVKTLCGDKYIYNFPGGGIEDGESLSECLIRECKEELGSHITIKDLLSTSDKLYTSTFFESQKFNIYYDIDVVGTIDSTIEGAKWFDLNDLPIDMMLESDKDFIKKYK